MPKLKPGAVVSSREEDVAISAAALSDADATPFTDAQSGAAKPPIRIGHPKVVSLMNKQTSKQPIPAFTTEAQERAYWETHDSTVHVDWSKAQRVKLPHLRPSTKTISLRKQLKTSPSNRPESKAK